MELRDLQQLVMQGEGLHLEFKEKFPEPAKLIREVTALANTEGGYLLLGVEDSGEIKGVKDPFEITEAFQQAVERFAKPVPEYKIQEIPISRKRSVIAVHIPESDRKPHRVKDPETDGKLVTVIRIRDRSATASNEMYHILRHRQNPRDIKVEYGEKESKLMQFLHSHGTATLKDFMEVAQIPRYVASRTLVHLVRANVLEIQPGEGSDRFQMKTEN